MILIKNGQVFSGERSRAIMALLFDGSNCDFVSVYIKNVDIVSAGNKK